MLSSKNLYNKRVYVEGNKKSYGRIRAFLFVDKNCVGFSIKRPDILWMFHRKPQFVSLNQIKIKNNQILINKSKALSSVNKNKEDWINWIELPVNIGKETLGYVERVNFDEKTGKLDSIGLSQGVISGVVLGKSHIKAQDIKGYSEKYNAIMLKENANIYEAKKGAAENLGKATSYVIHKVKKTSPKVINSMQEQSDKIHDMFHEFKDEIKKGMEDTEQE